MEPDSGNQISSDQIQALVHAAVRQYATRLGQRLFPFAVTAIALTLVVVYLPSKSPASTSGDSSLTSSSSGSAPLGASPYGTTGQSGATAPGGNSSAGSGGFQVPGGTSAAGSTATGGQGPAGPTGSVAPGGAQQAGGHFAADGVSVNGVKCRTGVKQVSWEPYAPPCLPRWIGDNGGATAHGVTATTITFTYTAYPDLDSLEQKKVVEEDEALIGGWIKVINKTFELYGRHIVLKIVKSSGTAAAMFDNQDQQQARQDAQAAYDMGSFADISGLTMPPYVPALAAKHILFGGVEYMGPSSAQQYAPYAYGNPYWYAGPDWGAAAVATMCKRMKDLPAIFSTDATIQHKTRVFGLIYPDSPDWSSAGKYIIDHANACGIQLKTATYNPALDGEAQQAPQIIAQMRAAGVTTIIDPSDPLMIGLLAESSDKQAYYPEWMPGDNLPGAWRQYYSAKQLQAVIRQSTQPYLQGAANDQGCRALRVIKAKCYPDDEPDTTYYTFLNIVRGIQAAGPDLTPQNVAAGLQRLPDVTGGFGLWSTHRAVWQNPQADFVLDHWVANAKAADGNMGDFRPCEGGRRYSFANVWTTIGSGQLHCPS